MHLPIVLSTLLLSGHAAISLFDRDHLVREIKTPIELRQFLSRRPSQSAVSSCANGIRLLLLYSGLCPHCHAFAPVWSSLAQRLDCSENAKVELAAFECSGTSKDRIALVEDWNQIYKASQWANISEESETEIRPVDVCSLLVPRGYPTVLLSVDANCSVNQKFKTLQSEHDEEHIDVMVDTGTNLYIWPDRLSTTATDFTALLSEAGLAQQCQGYTNREQQDAAMINYLSKLTRGSASSTSSRWSDRARSINPDDRLHDAILGIHHILGAWIFGDGDSLSREEVTAAMNFMLLAIANIPDGRSRRSVLSLLELFASRGVTLSKKEYLDFIKNKLFILGIPYPSTPEDVRSDAIVCETNSCTVWTLMHVFASLNYHKSSSTKSRTRGSKVNSCLSPFKLSDYDNFESQLKRLRQGNLDQLSLCMTGTDTAEVWHQLIYHFFTCRTCRGHFHDAYEGCAADRCFWVKSKPTQLQSILRNHGGRDIKATEDLGLLLWLWRFHNVVNSRTALEKSLSDLRRQFDEKTADIKIKYLEEDVRIPMAEDCSTCRRSLSFAPSKIVTPANLIQFIKSGEDETKMDFDSYSSFHLSEVSRYLMKFYFDPKWTEFDSIIWNKSANAFVEETLVKSSPE